MTDVLEVGERLLALVRDGDRLLVGTGAGEPQLLLRALVEHVLPRRRDVELVQVAVGGAEVLAGVGRGRGHRVRFVAAGRAGTAAVRAGDAELFPASMSGLDRMIADGRLPIAGLLVAGVRAGDRISPGLSLDVGASAARAARFRALECNAALPATLSDEWIREEDCDLVVASDVPPPVGAPPEPTAVQRAIGEHVAAVVPDGAVLELGVGQGLAGIAAALAGRRRSRPLRIHTGLLTDDVQTLVDAGAVAGELPCAAGASVLGTAARGSAAFHRWIAGNPRLRMAPSADAHDIAHLAGLPAFTAVNSAGQVDLLGQVGCPSDDAALGGGGLADYATAGALRGGSIIALESRDRRDRSKIVVRAGRVQLAAGSVTHVVTEYGVAVVSGATAAERARRMIAVAHPEDRDRLRAEIDAAPLLAVGP